MAHYQPALYKRHAEMIETAAHVGQRLSLKGQTCTIRYIGPVADKQGEWLGVEWDDPSRGKHDGTHAGTSYFKCRSKSPTAASFFRPKQTWDEARTLQQALKEKYVSPQEATNSEIVYISGKHAEEVGLEKLAKRQAQLQGIHTLVLDRMCVRYQQSDDEADQYVTSLCANITSLDLGGNLFESWREILQVCRLFPSLTSLTLDGNRINDCQNDNSNLNVPRLRYLGLSNTLLEPDEIASITRSFPALQTIILANNELEAWKSSSRTSSLPGAIHSVDLSGNEITDLTYLKALLTLPNLHTLHLKNNKITSPRTSDPPSPHPLSQTLQTLDLRSNAIATWTLANHLPTLFPALTNLHLASNPLYTAPTTPPLTQGDITTLLLARLPQLRTLNHSTITAKERLNAETYYLGLIARELAQQSQELQRAQTLASHPRWQELCEEYGEPVIAAARGEGDVDPASLAARFVGVRFRVGGEVRSVLGEESSGAKELALEWTEDVPRSASVYALLGRVGKRLGVMPLRLRLVWETGERDPVRGGGEGIEAPEWWDSSDEDDEGAEGEMVAREVRLVAGTRIVGSYFEGREARVRVEMA